MTCKWDLLARTFDEHAEHIPVSFFKHRLPFFNAIRTNEICCQREIAKHQNRVREFHSKHHRMNFPYTTSQVNCCFLSGFGFSRARCKSTPPTNFFCFLPPLPRRQAPASDRPAFSGWQAQRQPHFSIVVFLCTGWVGKLYFFKIKPAEACMSLHRNVARAERLKKQVLYGKD